MSSKQNLHRFVIPESRPGVCAPVEKDGQFLSIQRRVFFLKVDLRILGQDEFSDPVILERSKE